MNRSWASSFSTKRIIRAAKHWLLFSVLGGIAVAQSSPNRPLATPVLPSYVPEIRNTTEDRTNIPEQSPGNTDLQKEGARVDVQKPPGNLTVDSDAQHQYDDLNEFQRFVEQTTGLQLPFFGADLFRNVPSTFAPVDHVSVPDEYILGPGDEILLRGWGQVDIDYQAQVDRQGKIYVPKVGEISVAGLKYGQLQPFLRASIGRVFKNFELNVTMGHLRSIQVLVVGRARHPGAYTISSLSTLVNAIFASGGPSKSGSMRHIQLRRANETIMDFDLYDLLLKGDKSNDARLLPGDVIFIPAIGPLAAVMGSVSAPAIYEFKENADLNDILQYAGGLTPTAARLRATIERIADRSVRTVVNLELTPEGLRQPLHNGDLITVLPLSAQFQNAVTLMGNVASPGRYPWNPGMRISDLIPNRESLITRDYWKHKSALGNTSDELILPSSPQGTRTTSGDKVKSYKTETPVNPSDHQGENREAEPNPRDEAERPRRQQVKRFAPDINWDYALIERFDVTHLASRLLKFNLGKVVLQGDQSENLSLEPGDVVTIFSQADVKVPELKQTKFVRLEGEFNASGIYEVKPFETLVELVKRVGGLTPEAYLFGAQLTRRSTREAQQERFNDFVTELELEIERNASAKSQNAVSPEDAVSLRLTTESQRRLVDKLKDTKVTGRIVLGIHPVNVGVNSLPAITLEDGDEVIIPYRPSVINVVGAVYNESSFIYETGKNVSYYLRLAGGGTRDADLSRMFLVRADGSVLSNPSRSSWFNEGLRNARMLPGDTLVVSERVSKTGVLKGLRDWSAVVGQFGIGIAAVHTLFP